MSSVLNSDKNIVDVINKISQWGIYAYYKF